MAAVLGGEVGGTFDGPDLVTLRECKVVEDMSTCACILECGGEAPLVLIVWCLSTITL